MMPKNKGGLPIDEMITPRIKAQRKYEQTHKEERKEQSGQFNTRLPREDFDEICAFLQKNHIRKIDLIYAGYEFLKEEQHMREAKNIGIWGRRHLDYLKEYKRSVYLELLHSGELEAYLAELNETASDQINLLISQMAQKDGTDEKLKAEDPMKWVGLMNNYRHCAEEFVCKELIYV